MKRPYLFGKWTLTIAILALCVLALLMSIILPGGNALTIAQINQERSYGNLKTIAYLVLIYKKANSGRFPERLKDLAPYTDGDFEFFYPPTPDFHGPSDRLTNPNSIDQYAGYILLKKANSGAVVCEKPSLWPDKSIGVGFADGTVKRLSPKQFENLNAAATVYPGPPTSQQRPGDTFSSAHTESVQAYQPRATP
jgi:hypothetical protein